MPLFSVEWAKEQWSSVLYSRPIPCINRPQPGIPMATARWTNMAIMPSWISNVAGSTSRCESLFGMLEPSPRENTYGPKHQTTIFNLCGTAESFSSNDILLCKGIELKGHTASQAEHKLFNTFSRCCLPDPHSPYKHQATIVPECVGNTWKNYF